MTLLSRKGIYNWLVLMAFFLLSGCAAKAGGGNADIGEAVDQKLLSIVSNPKVQISSNPLDYINASNKEYNDIVAMDKQAFTYLLNKFDKGDENGLEEWIMAKACCDILGEKNTVEGWSTGREWYEKYTWRQTSAGDLNKIFDSYSDKLDGAYAEGYGSSLVRLYTAVDKKLFVKSLSCYPKEKIDGIINLFMGELFIEGKKGLVEDFNKIKTEDNLTNNELYVVDKILSIFKEHEAREIEAIKSVSVKIDQITKGYREEKILSVKRFNGQYLLIESQKETYANKFDLYNLGTGQKDSLPTGIDYVTLQKVVSENELIFLASGRDSESNYVEFPYILRCVRDKDNNFKSTKEIAYFSLNESTIFGSKENEILSEISADKNCIRAVFIPKPGKEDEFYADYVIIPTTQTKYIPDKRQMICEFKNSQIDVKFINSAVISAGDNDYVDSLAVEQNGKNCRIVLTLNKNAKEYTCKLWTTDGDGLGMPGVDIIFR